jgi:hypothetical protein
MFQSAQILPPLIERQHPRKEKKKKKGTCTKVQASKQPKRREPQGGE